MHIDYGNFLSEIYSKLGYYAPPIERDICLGLCRNLERLSDRLKIGYFFAL